MDLVKAMALSAIKTCMQGGTCLAQSVGHATLDLGVVEFKACVGCRTYVKNKT